MFHNHIAQLAINYEFICNLRIVGSETFHVLLEYRAWRILSRPSWCARNSVMMTQTLRFSPCQSRLKKFPLKKTSEITHKKWGFFKNKKRLPYSSCESKYSWSLEHSDILVTVKSCYNKGMTKYLDKAKNRHIYPVLSLIPSFSIPDVLCDPTDLIWRKGTPFEVMTDRTAPSSDSLLAEVFWGFPQL